MDNNMESNYNKPCEDPVYKSYEPTIKIVSEDQDFNIGKLPGTAITGFIDVEKFITIHKNTFFIEKKLPFQILIISANELHCKEG